MSDDRTEIAATLDAINLAWLEGRYAEIAPHVHEDVIILAPGAPEVRGREAFIASYAEFGTSAKIHDFSPDPPVIESWGSTAVAYCPFTIDYEITSGRYRERGVDILVFLRTANRWQVCWRTLSSHPEAAADTTSGAPA
jgi:hypothetical protein